MPQVSIRKKDVYNQKPPTHLCTIYTPSPWLVTSFMNGPKGIFYGVIITGHKCFDTRDEQRKPLFLTKSRGKKKWRS